MAKSNTERQAEFREKMRQEGKTALHVWVTPQQAARIHAFLAPDAAPLAAQPQRQKHPAPQSLLVTDAARPIALPPIPPKAPASVVRDLRDAAERLRKKRTQATKLQADSAAIERWYRQTVMEFEKL